MLLPGREGRAALKMAEQPNNAEQSGDDDSVSGPNPEDWRAFRKALIERGIQLTTTDSDTERDEKEGAAQEKSNTEEDGRWGQGSLTKSVR